MMNRGVMDRQMFRNGGAAFPDLSGDGKVTQRNILMGRGVKMQQGGNPALEASIAAFMDQYGRAPTREEIDQIANAQRMMMQEGPTGPSNMSPIGPRGQGNFVPLSPQLSGPMTTGEEEGAGMLGGFAPSPSQELPPPVKLTHQFFQDRMPREKNFFPPRGDMEMDPKNLEPVIRRQEGGPVIQEDVPVIPESVQRFNREDREGAGMLGGFAPTLLPDYPGALTDESPEVTKDMLKRLRYIFQTDMYPAPRRLNEVETNNAYVMMLSEKGFTDDEIRELATNPSGRFEPREPVIRRQEGGPAMVMPSDMGAMAQQMPAAAAAMSPPEQEVVVGAMQASGGPEVQQMIASEAQSYGDPETAENYEEMMNMVRGDQATVEERRSELASLVGEQDAMQTPESVLALVQPIVQLSMVEDTMASGDNVDAGVGALAAQEMTTPVQGDMAGGVMTLAGGAEPQMQGMA